MDLQTAYTSQGDIVFENQRLALLGSELPEAQNQKCDEEPFLREQSKVNDENPLDSPFFYSPLRRNEADQHQQQVGNGGQLALHLAAKGDFSSIVKLLLHHGALINATDRQGKTALHYAAEEGHIDTTAVLLSWGADTTVIDSFGLTSLLVAASKGHEKVVILLIDNGADPNYPAL